MRAPATLTPHQQAAVDIDAPRLLLVASAGSGKTEVLTRRVIRHLQTTPGQTSRILTLTFTVRAAQELRTRLEDSVANEAWRVDSDTVHGFALDWLMRFGQSVNVFPDTVVYAAAADRLLLLNEVVRRLGEMPTGDLRHILDAIDDFRTRNPRAAKPREGPSIGSIPFPELYDGYLTALESANGIDFPGMLAKFLDAADSDPQFLRNFSETYRHVLVDEGQDLSAAQAEVIALLTSSTVSLFVVADDRQSINGFAGGSFANLKRLVGDEGLADALHLPHNFRCAASVLSTAEKLASRLARRPQTALPAEHAPPGSVRLIAADSPGEEAALVGRWVRRLLDEGLDPAILAEGEDPGVYPEDIAIIARTRWLLDPALTALEATNVEVSVNTDPQSLLKTPVGRLLVEGLCLVASKEDAPALRRANDELRGLGVASDFSSARALLDDLKMIEDSKLKGVGQILDGVSVENIDERLRLFLREPLESDLLQDVRTLLSICSAYSASLPRNRQDVPGLVRYIFRAQQAKPSDPGVRLLTIHRVKGLEFKAVALVGAYNGALPDYRARSKDALEEERRAFYVAMTRASRELLVTYPRRTTDRYGRFHDQTLSLFAQEAGLTQGPAW